MTIIKQVSITSSTHIKNLSKYLDSDRALMRDSQHIINEKCWDAEMNRTREAYGHNQAGHSGANTTYMYHQVIAFNPDECSFNGGNMTPEMCMAFARDWIQTRYPNQEAIWVLHQEHCKEDGTSRFAVHIGINRTNLETGRRLDEGRSKDAKIKRACAMRDMDKKWHLSQVRANERNSRIHAMQPTRAEKEMSKRGIMSKKAYIRQALRHHITDISRENSQTNRMRELAFRLQGDGIHMGMNTTRKQIQFRYGSYLINGNKLGRGFSLAGITRGLKMTATREMSNIIEQDINR